MSITCRQCIILLSRTSTDGQHQGSLQVASHAAIVTTESLGIALEVPLLPLSLYQIIGRHVPITLASLPSVTIRHKVGSGIDLQNSASY